MLRRLVTLLSAASLVLCAATCVLWVLGLRREPPLVAWTADDTNGFYFCAYRATAVPSGVADQLQSGLVSELLLQLRGQLLAEDAAVEDIPAPAVGPFQNDVRPLLFRGPGQRLTGHIGATDRISSGHGDQPNHPRPRTVTSGRDAGLRR